MSMVKKSKLSNLKCKVIGGVILSFALFLTSVSVAFAQPLPDYYTFYTEYTKPVISDNTGYLEVLIRNKNSNVHYMRIYYWTIQRNGGATTDNYLRIKDTDTNSLTLTPIADSGSYWALFCIKPNNDTLTLLASGPTNSEISISVTDNSSALEVVSMRAYGNYLYYGTDGPINTDVPFAVIYGDNVAYTFESMLNELEKTNLTLSQISGILYNLSEDVSLIVQYLESIDLSLDEIISILKDSEVVEDNGDVSTELDDVIGQYDDIEGGFVDDFSGSIGNLPSFDLNGLNEFQTTSMFISQQMQRIYESHENVRFLFTAFLTFGIALVLIGRGNK